jgi:hypothetical protein
MPTPSQGQFQSSPVKPRIFLSPPDRIAVRIPFDESTIQRLRSVPGSRWESQKGFWSFPRSRDTLEKLLAALQIDWHHLDHDVAVALGLIKATPAQPKQVSPTPHCELLRCRSNAERIEDSELQSEDDQSVHKLSPLVHPSLFIPASSRLDRRRYSRVSASPS